MTKITVEHLARGAFVYVRQSTTDQVRNNHESRRRQYGLADRARALGWSAVEVIDDDLGRSGSGVSRPGFEKLLAAICEGRVGAVVSIEARSVRLWPHRQPYHDRGRSQADRARIPQRAR
jgi:DNA invertase Pin-like site-specific DNA recombinase